MYCIYIVCVYIYIDIQPIVYTHIRFYSHIIDHLRTANILGLYPLLSFQMRPEPGK